VKVAADVPAPPQAAPAALPNNPFARRVSSVFATQVVQFGLAFATSILLRRILEQSDLGAFVAASTLPGMLSTLGMFGLPTAVNYFAGKGQSIASLMRAAFLFTAILSVALIAIVWLALPGLESSFLSALRGHDFLARVMLLSLPLSVLTSFGGSILYGRQDVRTYNFILLGQAATSLACAILLVGVLRLGVGGAVAGSVLVTALTSLAVMETVRRLKRRDQRGQPVRTRALASYGFRIYPASLSGYFNYRADTYLIQALLLSPAKSLAQYSTAVTMAELVFYVPNSIGTIFLPRVAGATEEDANRMLGRVARLSTLITVCLALALVPTAIVGIHVVLPLYADCLPAFFVLLPAVVSLSLAKIMTSYISGRGRAGLVSTAITFALVLNVVLNVILIPRFGIVGASMSSVVSYTAHAAITLLMASRMSGQRPLSLFVPGRAEVVLFITGLGRLRRQLPLLGSARFGGVR